MCKNKQIKKNEAPFACKNRINQPIFTSRQIWITLWKAISMLGI